MKKCAALLAVSAILLLSAAVTYAGHESMVVPYEGIVFGEKTMMPMPSAGDLRHHIIGQEPYKTWKLWPGKGMMYEGTEPHGAFLTTYVNDIALNSIEAKKGMQNNSIIVKENYTPDKKLAAVTVMYKVKGYNPGGGDWFWAKYDPGFKVLAEGKVEGCINCHGKVKDNDYIYSGKVMK